MNTTPSNLVSGAVWQRPTKKGSTNSTVLFLTNVGASEEVLANHPQQVVFLTEQFKVLSMDVDSFVSKRTFAGMDTDIDALLNMVVSPPPEEEEEVELDIDSAPVDESLFPSEDPEDVSSEGSYEPGSQQGQMYTLQLNVGPHPLAQKLTSGFIGYSESPFHTGDTLHTLRFALGNSGMTLSEIRNAFLVSDPNAIAKFEITTSTETFQVEVDCFVDVLLESSSFGGDLGCLYVTSAGDFRAAPVFSEEVANDQVGTSPSVADQGRGQSVVVQVLDESPLQVSVS